MIQRAFALTAAVLLLTGGALAGCATPEQVNSPIWAGPTATPDGGQFTPERANDRGVNGYVMMLCRSHVDSGAATDCRLAYEFPTGWGFGAAALRMQSGIDLRRSRAAIRPDGLVLVPVRFCSAEAPDCPPPPGGTWPIHWGDPRLKVDSIPPPVVRP